MRRPAARWTAFSAAPLVAGMIAVAACAQRTPATTPRFVNDGYEFLCRLPTLSGSYARIDRDHGLSVIIGRYIDATTLLAFDFYGPDTEVTCSDRLITLRRKQPDGGSRVLRFTWHEGRLAPVVKRDEMP
jgi:hypothetical protein